MFQGIANKASTELIFQQNQNQNFQLLFQFFYWNHSYPITWLDPIVKEKGSSFLDLSNSTPDSYRFVPKKIKTVQKDHSLLNSRQPANCQCSEHAECPLSYFSIHILLLFSSPACPVVKLENSFPWIICKMWSREDLQKAFPLHLMFYPNLQLGGALSFRYL